MSLSAPGSPRSSPHAAPTACGGRRGSPWFLPIPGRGVGGKAPALAMSTGSWSAQQCNPLSPAPSLSSIRCPLMPSTVRALYTFLTVWGHREGSCGGTGFGHLSGRFASNCPNSKSPPCAMQRARPPLLQALPGHPQLHPGAQRTQRLPSLQGIWDDRKKTFPSPSSWDKRVFGSWVRINVSLAKRLEPAIFMTMTSC